MKFIFLFLLSLSCFGATKHGASTRYYWTREKITLVVQKLYDAGKDVGPRAISKDRSECTAALIASVTGRKSKGGAFYAAACKYFENYSEALKSAGININAVRRNPAYDLALLRAAILALHDAGIDLNPRTLATDISPTAMQAIYRATGMRVRPMTIYLRILKVTGRKYRDFLTELGIDPNEVYRKHTTPLKFAFDWMDDTEVLRSFPDTVMATLRFEELSRAIYDHIMTLPQAVRDQRFAEIEDATTGKDLDATFALELGDALRSRRFEYVDATVWE